MQQFNFFLKNTKRKSYHQFSWFIVFLNVIAQWFLVSTPAYQNGIYVIVVITVIAAALAVLTLRDYLGLAGKTPYIIGTLYAAVSVTWIKWELYWVVAILAFFYILYVLATRKFEVRFFDNYISYPSVPRKDVLWTELDNVIIKAGILTIDFKNNTLIQVETEDSDVNEREFNEFCKKRLKP